MLMMMKAIAKPTAHQPSRALGRFKKAEPELAIFDLLLSNTEKRSLAKPDGLRLALGVLPRVLALGRAWTLFESRKTRSQPALAGWAREKCSKSRTVPQSLAARSDERSEYGVHAVLDAFYLNSFSLKWYRSKT